MAFNIIPRILIVILSIQISGLPVAAQAQTANQDAVEQFMQSVLDSFHHLSDNYPVDMRVVYYKTDGVTQISESQMLGYFKENLANSDQDGVKFQVAFAPLSDVGNGGPAAINPMRFHVNVVPKCGKAGLPCMKLGIWDEENRRELVKPKAIALVSDGDNFYARQVKTDQTLNTMAAELLKSIHHSEAQANDKIFFQATKVKKVKSFFKALTTVSLMLGGLFLMLKGMQVTGSMRKVVANPYILGGIACYFILCWLHQGDAIARWSVEKVDALKKLLHLDEETEADSAS